MPRELSEKMKEYIASFECLSNGNQFKDHITRLFYLTSQSISEEADGLIDEHDPSIVYDVKNNTTNIKLVLRTRFVELRDQVIRPTNRELNDINGDGKKVPDVGYVLLEREPDDWEDAYTSYYTLIIDPQDKKEKYVKVTGTTAPEWKEDTYYKEERS